MITSIRFADALDFGQSGRNFSARDDSLLRVIRKTKCGPNSAESRLASQPQQLPLLLVFRATHLAPFFAERKPLPTAVACSSTASFISFEFNQSTAAASSGYPAMDRGFHRAQHPSSIISTDAGVMPLCVIATTVFAASSTVLKIASSVPRLSGIFVSFTMISVVTASVPSEPYKESRQVQTAGSLSFAAQFNNLPVGQHEFSGP